MEIAANICESLPYDFTILQAALGECSLAESGCRFHQKNIPNGKIAAAETKDSHALCKKKTLTPLPLLLTVS